jgi:diguanylate cyclase (GGDEF)-like protein
MRILIIDDSPDALAVARLRLAKENVEIVCADGGATGLEAARREKPDLILLDVDMPEMSGFEVCRILKSDSELCMVPVLFLSGSVTPEDKVKGLDLGAVDYVAKPFDAFELRARVRAALRTKHLQDLLMEHAHIDPLTGLPNRRALAERLQEEWARIERHGGQMSFVMADIDHFKTVNDRYGHHVGDRVLQEAAGAIAGQCRKTDFPARYGGEEFAIVVPHTNAAGAAALAERCRREICKTCLVIKNETVRVTASFGVADADAESSLRELIRQADEAMYQAKNAGRDQIRVSTPTSRVESITPIFPVADQPEQSPATTE